MTHPKAQFENIQIAMIPDQDGVMLRNFLVDRLNSAGEPESALYDLNVSIRTKSSKLGVSKSDVATRAQLISEAKFALVARSTQQILLNDSVQSINSYNILDSQFTTEVTQADAKRRGLEEVSALIERKLALFFLNQKHTATAY